MYKRRPLSSLVPRLDALGLDLLGKLLEYRPEKRITAAEAMKHEYFDELFGK